MAGRLPFKESARVRFPYRLLGRVCFHPLLLSRRNGTSFYWHVAQWKSARLLPDGSWVRIPPSQPVDLICPNLKPFGVMDERSVLSTQWPIRLAVGRMLLRHVTGVRFSYRLLFSYEISSLAERLSYTKDARGSIPLFRTMRAYRWQTCVIPV